MTTGHKACIFLVDDEPGVLTAAGRTLEQFGAKVSTFTMATDCLGELRTQPCDLLITDVMMPEMDGIELLSKARRIVPSLPVLVITGYGDIAMAVRAMRAGASDFIEKPLDRKHLLACVESILDESPPVDRDAYKLLTKSEIKVLHLILDGNSNKGIAQMLCRSVRTVEDHRGNIMRKLGVDNIVSLVRKAASMGLIDLQEKR
jgi:FixJ family two-component response regulator